MLRIIRDFEELTFVRQITPVLNCTPYRYPRYGSITISYCARTQLDATAVHIHLDRYIASIKRFNKSYDINLMKEELKRVAQEAAQILHAYVRIHAQIGEDFVVQGFFRLESGSN